MPIKLEACPFCDSHEVIDHILIRQKILFIKCNVCGCTGPLVALDLSIDSAIASVESALEVASAYWNRRGENHEANGDKA